MDAKRERDIERGGGGGGGGFTYRTYDLLIIFLRDVGLVHDELALQGQVPDIAVDDVLKAGAN